MTRVVVYCSRSAERSVDRIATYAVLHDLKIVATRATLCGALTLVADDTADGILVTSLRALGPTARVIGDLIEAHFMDGTSLHCVDDAISSEAATGRMVLNVFMTIAKWEREAELESESS